MFPYEWHLKNGYPEPFKKNKYKVFGTFICGGGSTMGYKLAGFNHFGGVEIDPKIAKIYNRNHKPKYLFVEDIRKFRKQAPLPTELFDLDILDGSPPCSSFSLAGNRDKDWGKDKKFAEGQALQTLDDLFFEYIELAERLKPKVIVAENVKGLIAGNAKAYVNKIVNKLKDTGYTVQLFLLNSASMGVPQVRERVFFICHCNDLALPKLKLKFNGKAIPFKDVHEPNAQCEPLTDLYVDYWNKAKQGEAVGKYGALKKQKWFKPVFTIAGSNRPFHPKECRRLSDRELMLCGSYPLDYNFGNVDPCYLIGMSVPPVMMAEIANQIKKQWLDILE